MRTARRRRLERKTDYKARLEMLKSRERRIIARKTNKYIIGQIVETDISQDKTIAGATSKFLLQKGWPKSASGSLKSLPAAYLTGYLIGKIALEKKIKKAIFDIGMSRSVLKSRLFAFLKGALDSGLEINHNPKALPEEADLNKNEKISSLINKIKEKL